MLTSTPAALVAAAPTLFRQGLLALFHEQWPHVLVTLTADASQVVELVVRRTFRLIVLEATLPGLDVAGLLAWLHRARPAQRLLVLEDSHAPTPRNSAQACPGTHLLVPSQMPPQALATALAPWLDEPEGASSLAAPSRMRSIAGSFSARELEVLRLVVDDHCNEEIADQLCLSVRTVESHRRTLLHKAGTRTLVGLAARAVREGWVA